MSIINYNQLHILGLRLPIYSQQDLLLIGWLIMHLEDRQEEVQLPKTNLLQVLMADSCLQTSKIRSAMNQYRVEKQG